MEMNVVALLAQAKAALLAAGHSSEDDVSWEDSLYDRLLPHIRREFPQDKVAKILSKLSPPDRAEAVDALRRLRVDERRTQPERRIQLGQRIELETGKVIWYSEDQVATGFERRTRGDRRRDDPL